MKPVWTASKSSLFVCLRFGPTVALGVFAATLAVLPGARPALAQQDPASQNAGEIETARNSFAGIVNANSVFVRSGPTDSAYSTQKLNKGDRVTVVGVKLDWLKIVPPEGSFCYIGKLYIDRHGDGTQGRINKDKVNVRAGSNLNSMTYAILSEAAEGTEVTILGEHDEYYKIKPPESAFLYVNKQYVDPDPSARPQRIVSSKNSPIAAEPQAAQPQAVQPEVTPATPPAPAGGAEATGPTTNPAPQIGVTQAGTPVAEGTTPMPAEGAPATRPAGASAAAEGAQRLGKVAAAPTTQPNPLETPAGAEAYFAKTEADYTAASDQPLEQQAIAPILAAYQALAASDKLPDSLRRVAETRASVLTARASAAEKLATFHKAQDEQSRKQLALQAEGKELEERLAQSGVKLYTAVGELRPSSLQLGAQTLYRLTDPATGRTVCYVRTSEAKYVTFLGQFVGVKGDISTDAQLSLKVLTPTDVEPVDINKVNNGIAAQVVPPSLMARPAAASIR